MRRREQVESIVRLFKELWDDLAVEAAVATYSTLCSDDQLTALRERLENDLRLRKMVDAHLQEQANAASKKLTVAESGNQ